MDTEGHGHKSFVALFLIYETDRRKLPMLRAVGVEGAVFFVTAFFGGNCVVRGEEDLRGSDRSLHDCMWINLRSCGGDLLCCMLEG